MADLASLIEEAKALDLIKPQGAFEVHCGNCHTRLDPSGDCPTCGLIGRPASDLERRAQNDAAGLERLVAGAIAKRKAYRPVKAARE